ncbi:MAG: peptide-methionine (S)-S-oxide reductase MsrA [Pseudomonadota bacterium]
MELATFGMGCFWGVELLFRKQKGVVDVVVGYAGGHIPDPGYRRVCQGNTGHAEVVQVHFDPRQTNYEMLLDCFWDNHDPTTKNAQGPDFGHQYRSVIFTHSDKQQAAARASVATAQTKFRNPIVTEITPFLNFFAAEDYHQRYLEKRGAH